MLMPREIASEVGEFILPFSVLSEKRRKPFTSDMELAAIFSVMELDRKKGGGIILKRAKEKIAFIAKIGYPLWLYPLSDTILLFDGLNVSDYALPYALISNVKALIDSLKTSSKTHETHLAFLSDHTNYFSTNVKEKSLPIKGLIADSGFLKEIDSYRREAKKIEKQLANTGLLSLNIDEAALISITHELASLRSSFAKDVKVLDMCIQLLGKVTRTFLNELHDEVKAIREEFSLKISEEEEIVAPKVNALREDYDKKVIALAENFEDQQLPLHKEKLKLEKSKEVVLAKIEQYDYEAKTHADNDDTIGKQKWKQKSNEAKQELSAIQDQLKAREKTLKDIENQRASEALRLRFELEAEIKEARKNLVDIEASRDAKILVTRQEMAKLEKQTKIVSDQIGRTAKLREANIAQFDKFCLKPASEELNKALVYVPFYVACYDSGTKKRYSVLPPSVVGTIDISTRLKGALGKARIKEFLVPRFKEITALVKTIQLQSQQNSIFETELKEIGNENNILTIDSVHEEIEKGLLSLKDQGWLSDKDYGSIVASAKTDLSMDV
jgi:hypothetical protein